MKIICTQENLRNGLTQVSRIVGSSTTLPILNNVLLQTENGQLKISATNLEMGISTLVRCKIELDGGVCVAAKVLLDLVNNLPSENITIESGDAETSVRTERYQTKIKHLPIEDFPSIPTVDDADIISITAADLRQAFDSTAFAASTSETQPEISGVLMKFNDSQITITATDRYRLAESNILGISPTSRSIIVPQRSVLEISRLLTSATDSIKLNVSQTQLSLVVGGTYLVTRLIDGQYPEYSQIIPSSAGTVVSLDHNQLLSALKTSGIFSRGAGSVTIGIDAEKQVLQVMSQSQGVGESMIEIPCEIQGASTSVILNYRYILDLLTNTDSGIININVIDDTNPVVFRPQSQPNYLYLIMPIRL